MSKNLTDFDFMAPAMIAALIVVLIAKMTFLKIDDVELIELVNAQKKQKGKELIKSI